MTISDGDQRRMDALRSSLQSIETEVEASPEHMAVAVAASDRFRLDHGIPPLASADQRPEEEFHRRARALGFRRLGR